MTTKSSSARANRPSSRATPSTPETPPSRVTRLKTLDDVRVELGRIYREARTKKLPLDQAKGLAYLLQVMSALMKDTELERRIVALEGDAREHR